MPIPVWCWILGVISLLVVILLCSKIKLVIRYEDSFSVYIKFLFLKFRLYPEKDKKKKRPSKAKKVNGEKPKRSHIPADRIIRLIKATKDIVADFASSFLGRLHIRFSRLYAEIACDDASKTALAYGSVTQSVAYTIEFLDNISNVDKSCSKIDIRANFISQKSWVDLKCVLYIRAFSLFPLGIKGISAFFKYKIIKEKILEVESDGKIEAK
jgi:hypothetical protein